MGHSSRGTPFTRWVLVGMPRIPPKVLDCVCYLYENEEDARVGRKFGGTAFFVTVPSRNGGLGHIYAVTNRHLACQYTSILRVNTHDGEPDIFPFEPDQWHFDPRFDIAVIPVPLRSGFHRFSVMPTLGLITSKESDARKIGPGDDVFMVGRFVDHDGGPTNRPAVRFGNISVMPAPIMQEKIGMADAFCIDLHSRSSYSGSPVFVYRMPAYNLEEQMPKDIGQRQILVAGANYLKILGIYFA